MYPLKYILSNNIENATNIILMKPYRFAYVTSICTPSITHPMVYLIKHIFLINFMAKFLVRMQVFR